MLGTNWSETWSLTLRVKHRVGIFENRMLKRIFGSNEVTEGGENCMMRSFVICTLRQFE
jgi:hypothetical protein